MGLFRKKKTAATNSHKSLSEQQDEPIVNQRSFTRRFSGHFQQQQQQQPQDDAGASGGAVDLSMVPGWINDLQTAKNTSGHTAARALRNLFTLSEHDTHNRSAMTRPNGQQQQLVPTLLDFLQRCERGSSEQYLTLLVLNNISIPAENKRPIALNHGGAKVLANLLCEDPGCHLMAIILVNLTFADAELRKDLVAPDSGIDLVESLAYVLRMSSLTPQQLEDWSNHHPPYDDDDDDNNNKSHGDVLRSLQADEERLRAALVNLDLSQTKSSSSNNNKLGLDHMVGALSWDPLLQQQKAYPETARWCLSALKNLTRPTKDSTSAMVLVNTGVVPIIMRMLTLPPPVAYIDAAAHNKRQQQQQHNVEDDDHQESQSGSSSEDTPPPRQPVETTLNSPAHWHSNSTQDAALFVVLNLAAAGVTREHIRAMDGVHILSQIAEFDDSFGRAYDDDSRQCEFQCLKARMALAYLVGSEGHFGQRRSKKSHNNNNTLPDSSTDNALLLLSETEALLLVELLADTLHNRAKEGPGGYSAATFSVKWVLYAIRCLLTQTMNQIRMVNCAGVRLNALFLKILAQHAVDQNPTVDADAAEHAAFCLYLQSNYGFKGRFLPAAYGYRDNIVGSGSLAAKILTSYIHMETVTPAGRHAADQLLLRLRYLWCKGTATPTNASTSSSKDGGFWSDRESDYVLDDALLEAADRIVVSKRCHGSRPRKDIVDRPILRGPAPKRDDPRAPWDNRASVRVYPSALHAVQDLSFGSTLVRHMDAIDDVLIANNIANSANGEKTESYNFWWSWEDAAGEIQKNLERQRSADSTSLFSVASRYRNNQNNNNVYGHGNNVWEEALGLTCGRLCDVVDTTTTSATTTTTSHPTH